MTSESSDSPDERPQATDQGEDAGDSPCSLSNIARQLLTGGAWALGGKIVTAGSGFLISVLVTRLLEPDEVGAYFLALSVATFAALAGRFGLEKTVLQMTAQTLEKGNLPRVRSVVLQILLLATLCVGLLGLALAFGMGEWIARNLFSSQTLAGVAALLAPWMAYLAFESLIAETFRGLDDIPRASLYNGAISRSLCVLGLALLLLSNGDGSLKAVVLLTIGCGVVGLLISGGSLERKLTLRAATSDSMVETGRLLGIAWPLLLSNVTLFVGANVDLWIVGAFRTEHEVALYGVAVRLVMLVGVALAIANAILPPLIGRMHIRGDRAELERIIRTTSSIAAAPSVLILLLFIVAGAPILTILFGPVYSDAASVLALLGLGQVVNVWVGSCGYVLIMTGHQRELLWSAIVSGAISVAGGLLTVGRFGPEGVAAAMMLSMVTQQILMLLVARKRVGVWTHAAPRFLRAPFRYLLDHMGPLR